MMPQLRLVWPMILSMCGGLCALAPALLAGDPPARPAGDDDVDFLLKKVATTAPASKPTTLPAGNSPLTDTSGNEDVRRKAVMLTSDGEKYRGRFYTTYEQPIRVFDPERKEYRDIPFKFIKTMEAKIIWEREEKEWHFKESGSDIKEYSGKTYPAREYQYTFTLVNGQTITGSVAAPIYMEQPKSFHTFVLHKRDKGEIGQTLKQLVYVQRMDFEEGQ